MPEHSPIDACVVCYTPTTTRCGRCAAAGIQIPFCSREHQVLIHSFHRLVCGGRSKPSPDHSSLSFVFPHIPNLGRVTGWDLEIDAGQVNGIITGLQACLSGEDRATLAVVSPRGASPSESDASRFRVLRDILHAYRLGAEHQQARGAPAIFLVLLDVHLLRQPAIAPPSLVDRLTATTWHLLFHLAVAHALQRQRQDGFQAFDLPIQSGSLLKLVNPTVDYTDRRVRAMLEAQGWKLGSEE